MPDSVKEGDTKTLRFDLGRDLSAVTAARVIISAKAGETPALNLSSTDASPRVVIEDAVGGIVALTLAAADYGAGKLVPGVFLVEIETTPGPLTHPDDGYERLTVVADLG